MAPFTVFLLCYGLATTCTLMGELPINVVGGVEKDNHLRRDFEYMNPRALRSPLLHRERQIATAWVVELY